MTRRGTRRLLFGFIVTAVGLVASDFALLFNHTWRLAVCVLLVVAVSMIVLLLRSLQRQREAAQDLLEKISNREAQIKANERRVLRAFAAAAVTAQSEREKLA